MRARSVLGIYVAGFLFGAAVHARDFVLHGPRPYAGDWPLALEAFWMALLPLDLLTAGLLAMGRRRSGLVLAAAVMLVDVAVNAWAMLALNIAGLTLPLLLQTLFLGFILGSIGFLWPRR